MPGTGQKFERITQRMEFTIHQFSVMQSHEYSYFRMCQRLFGFFKITTAMTQCASAATGSAVSSKARTTQETFPGSVRRSNEIGSSTKGVKKTLMMLFWRFWGNLIRSPCRIQG
ncbi:hypothetical protein CAEBREN_20010 [Caenorhabditis brenneri]|uniref:Uncharacterized protein n=1 Tax=Caenorhabditis brenneri TaxID=135651 RepID=G0NJF2_CAEBE|nr:hypothetical protein CAEBREN_20010 [Caenorhabditis brenneri]